MTVHREANRWRAIRLTIHRFVRLIVGELRLSVGNRYAVKVAVKCMTQITREILKEP